MLITATDRILPSYRCHTDRRNSVLFVETTTKTRKMAADRFNFNKSWEHIQNKHVGTGHSDITKFEWAVNQHRDTIASYLGHYDMISYFSVAQNESNGRIRYQLLEVRLFIWISFDYYSLHF